VPKNIANLQILRGFAAINVVGVHTIKIAGDYGLAVDHFSFLAGWGGNGVDIFFVLSGFIMIYSQSSKKITPAEFFTNRVIRIVPLYYALTIFVIALLALFPGLFNNLRLNFEHSVYSFLFISEMMLGKHPYIGVGWTLEYEFLFYTLFAASLFLKHDLFSFLFPIAMLVLLVAVAGTDFIVFEFAYGMVIGKIVQRFRFSGGSHTASFLVGAVLLLATLLMPAYPSETRFLYWGIPAALIVFGLSGMSQLGSRIPKFLGDSSYSIYLIHFFTVPAFYKAASFAGLTSLNQDLVAVFCIAMAVAAGGMLYVTVERPVMLSLRARTFAIRSALPGAWASQSGRAE